MASVAQSLSAPRGRSPWWWEWLRDELSPYPGRAARVARMVTAATLVMILCMTYRLSFAPYGAIYALVLTRESLEVTANQVGMFVVGLIAAGAYLLLGAMLVLGDPNLRLVWVIATFFLIFWAISATRNYGVAARFGYLIIITTPVWDRIAPADFKVTQTLWAIGVISGANIIALLLEVAYAGLRRGNDLMDPITDRLACVEKVLDCYAQDRPVDSTTENAIARLAVVGTSRLRRILRRSNFGPRYAQEIGAVAALVGRLVDLTANLTHLAGTASEDDRRRIARVAAQVAEVRASLAKGMPPKMAQAGFAPEEWPSFPLLGEIERTVSLIGRSFSNSRRLKIFAPDASEKESPGFAFSGAVFDREHVKFGLKGCLAASLCYIIYNALAWPEIATAVTTCYLTALTTIGASRQKQALRIGGALIGAALSLGAQVFVLPYTDSIVGFTVLFVLVAAFSAWIATSSPRLSYLGVQIFVAFALVHVREFRFQTSLTVGRDRVIGILLGLFVMWVCFDQLWSAPAAIEMRRAFVSSLLLLAQLAREPLSKDLRTAIDTSYVIREKIDAAFEKTRSLADGVLFEFGETREANLKFRDLVRRWQPQLSALFLMRIASLKYRLQAPGFETPEGVRLLQAAYDAKSADLLERLANRVEDAGRTPASGSDGLPDWSRPLDEIEREARRRLPLGRAESLLALLGGIDRLTASLAAEIDAEFAASAEIKT
jgi:multidrug resistance protein MdtO